MFLWTAWKAMKIPLNASALHVMDPVSAIAIQVTASATCANTNILDGHTEVCPLFNFFFRTSKRWAENS